MRFLFLFISEVSEEIFLTIHGFILLALNLRLYFLYFELLDCVLDLGVTMDLLFAIRRVHFFINLFLLKFIAHILFLVTELFLNVFTGRAIRAE